jgi:hypothetical protein
MGMFDYVTCEFPMPDGREVKKASFQTKALWCAMYSITITGSGRLAYNEREYTQTADGRTKVIDVGQSDVDYHGDLEIYGEAVDGESVSYAVRFTHGNVEWIRPLDTLSENHRSWLLDRGR